MVATAVRAAAKAKRSYRYYADAVDGNDAAAGTREAPFKTLEHYLSVAAQGERCGFLVNGQEFNPAATLKPAHPGMGFGRVDFRGDKPVINIGKALSGFEVPINGGTGSELATDGGVEIWTSATNLTNYEETTEAEGTVNRETENPHSGTYCCRLDVGSGGSNTAAIAFTKSGLADSTDYYLPWWFRTSVANKKMAAQAEITSGPLKGKSLLADGTWGTVGTKLLLSSPGTLAWQQEALGFTTPAGLEGGTIKFTLKRSDGNCSFYIDDLSLKLGTRTGTIQAIALTPEPTLVTVDGEGLNGKDNPVGLEEGWAYKGGRLYVELDGDDPDDHEVASTSDVEIAVMHDEGADYGRHEDYEITLARDRGMRLRYTRGHMVDGVDGIRCSSTESGGVISLDDGNRSTALDGDPLTQFRNCDTDRCMNDGMWQHNVDRLHVAGGSADRVAQWTRPTAQDEAADGFQSDQHYKTGGTGTVSANGEKVVRRWNDMRDTNSPKGGMLAHGTALTGAEGSGLWKECVTLGGLFGASFGLSDRTAEDLLLVGQGPHGETFSGGVYFDAAQGDLHRIKLRRVVIVGAHRHGFIANGGGSTRLFDLDIEEMHIVNPTTTGLNLGVPVSGKIRKVYVYWPGGVAPTSYMMRQANAAPEGELSIDECLFQGEYTSCFNHLGTAYSTLAAYKAASGQHANSAIGTPDFDLDAWVADLTRKVTGTPRTLAELA